MLVDKQLGINFSALKAQFLQHKLSLVTINKIKNCTNFFEFEFIFNDWNKWGGDHLVLSTKMAADGGFAGMREFEIFLHFLDVILD